MRGVYVYKAVVVSFTHIGIASGNRLHVGCVHLFSSGSYTCSSGKSNVNGGHGDGIGLLLVAVLLV